MIEALENENGDSGMEEIAGILQNAGRNDSDENVHLASLFLCTESVEKNELMMDKYGENFQGWMNLYASVL